MEIPGKAAVGPLSVDWRLPRSWTIQIPRFLSTDHGMKTDRARTHTHTRVRAQRKLYDSKSARVAGRVSVPVFAGTLAHGVMPVLKM